MTLEEYLAIGVRLRLGSHTFVKDEILRFASKYDPQRFHLDEQAARNSVFGGLCASGWHTGAIWMRLNVGLPYEQVGKAWKGAFPVFGPSPGIRDLRWTKPVMAGETVTYYRTGLMLRPHPRREGWWIHAIKAEGDDSTGNTIIEFVSSVLLQGPVSDDS